MIDFDIRGKRGMAITEKPSLARTIEAVVNKNKSKIPYELDFYAQQGHLVGLKLPDEIDEEYKKWTWDLLPITSKTFHGFHYKINQDPPEQPGGRKFQTTRERYERIEEAINSGRYDFIIHIGDPDREGQLLVDLVLEQIGNALPVFRYWQNATTEERVLEALLNLKSNDDEFYKNTSNAARARQQLDWLVGMNLSRGVSIKMGGNVPSGRVKDAIRMLVCRRELEIRNFKPKTTYGVKSKYQAGFDGTLFVDKIDKSSDTSEEKDENSVDAGVVWFETEAEAKALISKLSLEGVLSSFKGKRKETYAPHFFKMTTLQDAMSKFGYTTDEVAAYGQSLYESGYITYNRSTCEYVDSSENFPAYLDAVSAVKELSPFLAQVTPESIKRVYGSEKWVNNKEVKESGHTAIIPTSKAPNLDSLSKGERDVYLTVAKQFVAAFLPPLVQDVVDVVVTVDGENTFKSSGKTLVSPGYTEIFGRNFTDVTLPALKEGDVLQISGYDVSTKTTTCPKRYTASDLMKVCENPLKFLEDEEIKAELKRLGVKFKIGTPATLSTQYKTGIIDLMISRDKWLEVKKEGKRNVLYPTAKGMQIDANLAAIDYPLRKIDVTGTWEVSIEEIIRGNMTYEQFMASTENDIITMLDLIKNADMSQVKFNEEKKAQIVSKCQRCGGDIIQVERAFFCSNYKENGCLSGGYRNIAGYVLSAEDFKKLQAGEQLVVDGIFEEKNEKGKVVSKRKYKQRIGLNEKGTIEVVKNHVIETNFPCPACGKKILETDNAYYCEGRSDKSCNVYLGKVTSGVELKQADIDLILSGSDSSVVKKLVPMAKDGKKGKPYDAILFIDKEKRCLSRKFPSKETSYSCPVCNAALRDAGGRLLCSNIDNGSCSFQMYSTMYKKPIAKAKLEKMIGQVRSGEISGGAEAYITKGVVDTPYQCPYCATGMQRNGMQFACPSCQFSFFRTIGDELMTDEDVENLLTAGKTAVRHGLVSQKGQPYATRQVLDYDNKKLVMEYIQEVTTLDYDCPICSQKVKQNGLVINCDCGFKLWLTQGGVKLSSKELDDFFKNHITKVRKMKKKDGGSFEAMVAVDFENKGSRFVFPKKK